MIVMKFGGTSVADAQAITNVCCVVHDRLARRPLVVSSACAGVTNELLALAREAVGPRKASALSRVEGLRRRHRDIAGDLFTGDLLTTVFSQIDARMDELKDLARSISILGELTDRSLDTFASFGELLSTLLLYHHFRQEGLDAVLVDAREVMVTSAEYTRATPVPEAIRERAHRILRPKIDDGHVIVTQGFIGSTESGVTTTIGRGGSDYSASILGAALDAEEIQIWTDVDGMMTSDPSLISNARLIREMTFQEAAELAYFGARVLHPSTILPAVQKDIPVRILNSMRPASEGTRIVRVSEGREKSPVRAIASKPGITLINLTSTRMLMAHGFLARVFEIFARWGKSVDVIATSEVSVSLTIDSREDLDPLLGELRQIADAELEHDKAIVCVVGEHIKGCGGVVPRIFSTLDAHGIPVSLISLGASEINVTFVVDARDVRRAAEALHSEFFPGG